MATTQAEALRAAISALYRERQSMVSVIDALFKKLADAQREGQRLYDLGYKHGLRNQRKK